MECPKCGTLGFGNFCSNCGQILREKCKECGKMEIVGQEVCDTALEKARFQLEKYKDEKVGTWRRNLGLLLSLPFLIGGVFSFFLMLICLDYKANIELNISWMHSIGWIHALILLISMFSLAVVVNLLCLNWQKKTGARAEENFLEINQETATILEKGEKDE